MLLIAIAVSTIGLIALNFSLFGKGMSPNVLFQQTTLLAKVAELEAQVIRLEEDKRQALLYKKWADDIIFKRLNFEDIQGKGTNGLARNTLDGEINDSFKPAHQMAGVEKIDVRRINLALDFDCSFNLIKQSKNNSKLSGHLFIVASNRETIPKRYSAWPPIEIIEESGLPADYKKGDDFNIRYMKQVKGRITQPEIGPKFNRIDLIAYSDTGELIMKQGYYIERLLQESHLR